MEDCIIRHKNYNDGIHDCDDEDDDNHEDVVNADYV